MTEAEEVIADCREVCKTASRADLKLMEDTLLKCLEIVSNQREKEEK